MGFEGNLAKQLPVQPVEQEEIKKSDAELLRELRMKQISEEFTPEERETFLKLVEKETELKTGIRSISELERNRFQELSKKQAGEEAMSPSEVEELAFLYDRIEGQK